MRRKMIRTICVLTMCMMVFTLMPMKANAANSCSSISGNSKYTKTFTVKTGKGFITGQSIKFTQSVGKIRGPWTKNMCAKYYITVKYSGGKNNGKVYKKCEWTSGSSYNLKLGKNTNYKVTLQPYSNYSGFHTWVKPCYWSVKKTRNVILCY